MSAVAAVAALALSIAHPSWASEVAPWQWLDPAVGLLASAAILAQRRWPALVAWTAVALTAVAHPAGAAMLASLFLLGLRQPFRMAAWVGLAATVAVPVPYLLRVSDPSVLEVVRTLFVAASIAAVMLAWGVMLRTRVELTASLAERAERAETATALGMQAARHAERTKIAREMHDALAQRISRLSIQAGSLTHRRNLSQEELREGLETIRSSAHEALQDLREILGVLREPASQDGSADRLRPQPSLADLQRLLESLQASGVVIDTRHEVEEPEGMGALCSRTLYRVAQEALTNAVKHAPGTPIQLCLVARPNAGAQLRVVNQLPANGLTATAPGTRTGLIGIRERVALAGGQVLRCGPSYDSSPARFCVEVELPWSR
jgi:signal transduction histidine kinase